MTDDKRKPLSDAEREFLERLANGNALARQRRRDREEREERCKPPPEAPGR